MHKQQVEPEHLWLDQFAGKWSTEGEIFMKPGDPPQAYQAIETVRKVGDYWLVLNSRTPPGAEMQFEGVIQIGYDPKARQFVGTCVDNMSGHLWVYAGERDNSGNALVLRTEAPACDGSGKTMTLRETHTLVDENTRTFRAELLGEAGEWGTVISCTSRRQQP